jgi:hypothetical protein
MCERCHAAAEPYAEAVLECLRLNLEHNNENHSLAYYAIIGALVRLHKANKFTMHGESVTDFIMISQIMDDWEYLNSAFVEITIEVH